MDALLTHNIFALSLPIALVGAAVFGGLIAGPFCTALTGRGDGCPPPTYRSGP